MEDEKNTMETEKEVEETVTDTKTDTETQTEKKDILEFSKPYVFERKEYKEIDLSGIKKLTVKDAVEAQGKLFDEGEVAAMLITERTTAFARKIAAKATGYPIEFFKLMPRGPWKKVQKMVVHTLSDGGESKDHVMKFKEPYQFEGKEYTQVDLNGLADMTCMNESEAENRLTRAGITITEPTYNYLYSCILASMATGLPENFFTGLPIAETLNLKTEVNSPDFFE
jgi:hypothetical protein